MLNGANCVNFNIKINFYEYKDYIYKYNNMNANNNSESKNSESKNSESKNSEWTILLTNNNENENKTEKGGFIKKIKTVSKRMFSKKQVSKTPSSNLNKDEN
jgi:hypothetical protein